MSFFPGDSIDLFMGVLWIWDMENALDRVVNGFGNWDLGKGNR
jgi:hypothetical protein